jgi:hypothetical protein
MFPISSFAANTAAAELAALEPIPLPGAMPFSIDALNPALVPILIRVPAEALATRYPCDLDCSAVSHLKINEIEGFIDRHTENIKSAIQIRNCRCGFNPDFFDHFFNYLL